MKFEIRRTSDPYELPLPKPCEEASKEYYTYNRKTIVLDENGNKIVQLNPTKAYKWVIYLNSLDDLMELQEEVDDELIISYNSKSDVRYIEIYDDYRE